jgi:hypothetical protein
MVTKRLAPALKKTVLLPFAFATMILTAGGPFGRPVVDAQGPPDLEARHRQLLPLFELAGVVFTDADESSGRFVVGVLDRGVEGLVRARLATLGVPSQIVDVVETEAIVPVATLRDKVRPVEGGLQIRFTNYLCSLGFVAVRDGVTGYVTASHCSTTQGSVDSTKYYQPLNQNADEFIGTEIADPSFFRNGDCPRGRKCRYSDANFSQGAGNASSFGLGLIAKTDGVNTGSLQIGGTFGIAGEGAAFSGQTANKVGRTTGWTQGMVTNSCADTGVSGTNIVLLCQTFVEGNGTIVGSGDSGSPVFRIEGGDNVTLLGGLWGGNQSGTMFVYSPISAIKSELGGTISTK